MKRLHNILFILSLIILSGLNAAPALSATTTITVAPDTIHTREYIESISITEPHRALQVIDETEKLGLMPQYHLDHLRSVVYQNGLSMYRYALLTLELITDQYNNTDNYTESIRYAIEGIEIARQAGNKSAEANLLFYIAVNKRRQGLKKEGESYIKQSMELLEEVADGSRDWQEVDDLIYFYGTVSTYALDDGEYHLDGLYDMRLASIYALYTCIYSAKKEMDKAEEYYRKFNTTEYSHTDDGNQMRFEYLLAAKRYHEALQFIHHDKENYRA